jgi:hypothetical protein
MIQRFKALDNSEQLQKYSRVIAFERESSSLGKGKGEL